MRPSFHVSWYWDDFGLTSLLLLLPYCSGPEQQINELSKDQQLLNEKYYKSGALIILSPMAHSWKSLGSWSDFTGSASNSARVHSWVPQRHRSRSDFGDLDPAIPPASLIRAQPIQDRSWSPCPSWTASSWSPCQTWSSSQGSINGYFSHHEEDGDYSPPHVSRPPNSPSRSLPDENVQKSQIIGMSSIADADFSCTSLMHHLAPHLANPKHWVPAYRQVKDIKPGNIISIAVLDFFLSCESHRSRFSLCSAQSFYYIDQNTLGKLTGDFKEDHTLLRNFLAITTEEILLAPFLILITTGHNTYFLAMFDFLQDRALILGRRGPSDFNKEFAEWGSWNGPTLWQKIHNALNLHGSEEMEVDPISYETDLIPVTNIFLLLI